MEDKAFHSVDHDLRDILLPNMSFDFALNMDVIEHLSRERRPGFIDELSRVASRGIVIGGPFKSSMNEESEAVINEFHKTMYGKDNPWLSEHFRHELPDLDDVSQHMHSSGFHFSILPNGYLPR